MQIKTITGQAVLPSITIKQMCRDMPEVFRLNWPAIPPSQTLEQWAALA